MPKKDDYIYDVGDEEQDENLEDTAAMEDTGEADVTEGEAADIVAEEETFQKINLTTTEVPELAGLQPGDNIDLITTARVIRGDGTNFEMEIIDIIPAESLGADEQPDMMGPGGSDMAGGGAGSLEDVL